MLNLMVDKETLALHENAVIVQIALVAFDEHQNPVEELDLKLDVTASLLDGFEVDPKTARDFWSKQPKATIRSVLYDGPRLPPKDAARVIDRWLKDTFKGEEFTIWANGILFDIPKCDGLLTRYGMKPLTARTKYNRVYDFRTLRATAKMLYPDEVKHAEEILKNQNAHNALDDCYWQIGMLSAILAILARQYEAVDPNTPSDLDYNPPAHETGGQIEDARPNKVDPLPLTEASILENLQDADADANEPRWEDEDVHRGEDFLAHVYGETLIDSEPH